MGGDDTFRELCADVVEMLVHVGLMASVMPNYPEDVQENFWEKVEGIRARTRQEIEEVQVFGEAFDDEADEDK